jgi:putative molybdopterin biosynthesis protein
MEPVMYSLQEVASLLRVHPSTVYRLIAKGKLPAFKIGRDFRFNRETIERWRFEQEQLKGAPTNA